MRAAGPAQALVGTARRAFSTSRPVIAVVSPRDNPALKSVPKDRADFLIADNLETMLGYGPELLGKVEGLLWIPPGPPPVLSQLWAGGHLPLCKWVHGFYAGVDGVGEFVQELESSEVPLTNGRGAFSASLAEYAITAALHFTKQVPRCMGNHEDKVWDKFEMSMLRGKTLGLVGYGDIAKETARLAKAFGMRVVALRRNAGKPDEGGHVDLVLGPYEGEIQPAHKRALLEQSDVVVCSLPGTAETRHFLSTEEFGAMKDDAVFISLGRGVVVDEAALAATLAAGRLRGAALDVFEVEPLPQSSPLWSSERLLLTAHNADFTDDYFEQGWRVWAANLDALQAGQPPVTPVDKRAGY